MNWKEQERPTEKKLLANKPETNPFHVTLRHFIYSWNNFLHSFVLLIYAFNVGYGRREVVELLLANGASIQACDEGNV